MISVNINYLNKRYYKRRKLIINMKIYLYKEKLWKLNKT